MNVVLDLDGDGTCRWEPQRSAIVMDGFTVTDPVVIVEARRWTTGERQHVADDQQLAGADLGPFVRTALQTYCVVAQTVGDGRDAAGLQHTVADLTSRTERRLVEVSQRTAEAGRLTQEQLDKTREQTRRELGDAIGQVRSAMHATTAGVTEEIMRLFAGEDPAIVGAARTAISKALSDVQSTVERRMGDSIAAIEKKLDSRDPTSPVGQMLVQFRAEQDKLATAQRDGDRQVADQLQALSTTLTEITAGQRATAKTAAVTTLKGISFEDAVHLHLEEVAKSFGDAYTDTSATTGRVKSSKKGDGVLTILDVPGSPDGTARVVVEMHNGDTGGRQWSPYLDEAMRNRDASASLGVVRTRSQVPGGDPIRVWGNRKILVAFDPDTDEPTLLRTVLLLLRAQAFLAVSRSGTEQVRVAEEQLAVAAGQLEQFAELQRLATTVKTNADRMGPKLDRLHEVMARTINTAITALHEANGTQAA